jgi:hypothetical protein
MPEFECSLSEAREQVEIIMKTNTAVMLWAPPGIGKSSMVKQLAKDLGLPVIDIRLAQYDPLDLKGIPTINGNKTTWLTPEFFPTEGKGILFLDELTCAAPSVQNAALQLVLDRKLNNYEVPEGWKIIAAGNTAEHGAFVSKLSNPMKNRMAHIYIAPFWEDVKQYFVDNNIRPEIVSFLDWRPELMHKMPTTEEAAFPTPRTWEKFSDLLYAAFDNNKVEGRKSLKLGMCIVGQGASVEFSSFIDIYVNIKPDEIIEKGSMPSYSDSDVAIKYASCGAVCHYFTQKIKKPNKNQVKHLIAFIELLEPEFQVKVMKQMNWLKNKAHYRACLEHSEEQARFHELNSQLTKLIS